MSTAPSSIFNFPGTSINQPPPPPTSPVSPTSTSTPFSLAPPNLNPGNLANPMSNIKDIQRNTGLTNLATGDLRNQLIPQFAQFMAKYGLSAGDFFKQLMDKGSPFYQQRQTEAMTSGVKANQDAAAQARQQASAAGTGFTPSGTNIAMIGGMNEAGGQSLAEQFLQNLFQNENLMVQGAQGEKDVASLFNPSSLFGSVPNPGTTQGPSAADSFAAIMKGLGIGGEVPGTGGGVTFGGG